MVPRAVGHAEPCYFTVKCYYTSGLLVAITTISFFKLSVVFDSMIPDPRHVQMSHVTGFALFCNTQP